MSIYKQFYEFILKHGEKIREQDSLLGKKYVIKYKNYIIQTDSLPFSEKDLIVCVIDTKTAEVIYISPNVANAARCLGWDFMFPHEKADPKILENLLKEFRGENV